MDIGAAINSIADAISGNKFVAAVLDNPIFTALLITAIVVLIFMFAGTERHASVFTQAAYAFLAIAGVMFLYHKNFLRNQTASARADDVVAAMFASTAQPPVQPSVQPPVATINPHERL